MPSGQPPVPGASVVKPSFGLGIGVALESQRSVVSGMQHWMSAAPGQNPGHDACIGVALQSEVWRQ